MSSGTPGGPLNKLVHLLGSVEDPTVRGFYSGAVISAALMPLFHHYASDRSKDLLLDIAGAVCLSTLVLGVLWQVRQGRNAGGDAGDGQTPPDPKAMRSP